MVCFLFFFSSFSLSLSFLPPPLLPSFLSFPLVNSVYQKLSFPVWKDVTCFKPARVI